MAYHERIHRVRPLLGFFLPGGMTSLFLAMPLFLLLWRGVESGLSGYLTEPSVFQAALLSMLTSFISLAVTLLLGTPLAYMLARWSFRHKTWIELVIDLPIVVPPMVAGIGLLLLFGSHGVLGIPLKSLGVRLPFTTAAVIFAQTFVSAPLYIRAARLGFAAVCPEIIEAAYTDGASEQRIFWTIMIPLGSRAMLNGLILSWARAFGEFGATIIFAGNLMGVTQTMPLVIFNGFETNLGVALGLSLILIVISAFILYALRLVEKETRLAL
jgi:molybdate transport system permease protein